MRVNVGDPVGRVGSHLVVSLLLLAIGTVTADRERVQLRVSGESHLVLCEEKVLSLLPFSFSIGNVLKMYENNIPYLQ